MNILIYKALWNDYTKLEKIWLQINTQTFENSFRRSGGGAAAERKKGFFPKIAARLVLKIKNSFFSPFLINGYILSCKCQKYKKIILSYMSSYSESEVFHIVTYITAAVRKRQKIQSSIIFYRILHKIANILIYKTLWNDQRKMEKILSQKYLWFYRVLLPRART